MHKPNVLLLGASEILESALRAALKESCKLIAFNTAPGPAAEEYQRRKASAAIVVLDPTLPGTVVSISGAAIPSLPSATSRPRVER
jgi:hypothetical protein